MSYPSAPLPLVMKIILYMLTVFSTQIIHGASMTARWSCLASILSLEICVEMDHGMYI